MRHLKAGLESGNEVLEEWAHRSYVEVERQDKVLVWIEFKEATSGGTCELKVNLVRAGAIILLSLS